MKKLFLFLTISLIISQLSGQAPVSFNYQAVLRDAAGAIRTNASATVRIDLLKGSSTGASVYAESFAITTNAYGLINILIGKGTPISGSITTIDWGSGPYFIKVSVDGSAMGTSQLLSVPYALYAGNGFSGSYNALTDKPVNLDASKAATATGTESLISNIGSFNTADGYRALYANTDGSKNTAIGAVALQANKSGSENTAVGSHALYKNTIGGGNIAIGYSALYSNISGIQNCAIGDYALYNNSTGTWNTSVGSIALYENTTGNSNTSIGSGSMRENTTGEGNTATGAAALTYNKTGADNVAVGTFALFKNQSGNKNSALGAYALASCTGWDNTATGYFALNLNTTGFDNVAMGVESLRYNTTGNGNTAIGKNSMISLVEGNNNTAVGFNSNISSGISNSTAIGYQATVTSSNKIVLGNGNATSVGGYGAWVNWSDRRLKENITYTSGLGLNFITQLKPASYNYIKDTNRRRRDGLIAQDVQQTLIDMGLDFSGLIIDDDPDKTLNLSYAEFVIPLINAVQELNKKNQQLQKKTEEFEQALAEMKSEIASLTEAIKPKQPEK